MKKLLLFIFTLSALHSYAQWNVVNTGTVQDLYSVDYYSATDTWIGSYNQFVKTTNGGTSWSVVNPLLDNTSITIAPANMYDIAVTSPTNAIAAGFYLLGNVDYLLNTTNGGANWNYAYQNNTVGLPRYFNAVDASGSRAVAVGNDLQIAVSNNAGATWSIAVSGINHLLSDVKFISYDTVIAVGTNYVFKSNDGGTTWSNPPVTANFTMLACAHNVVYCTKGNAAALYKSTNYGTNWVSMSLPFANTSYGAIYAITKDTLIIAATNGVYISKSGGQYWEKYVLPNYQQINMFDFLNPTTAIGVGMGGYVIKTSNFTNCASLPMSSFTVGGVANHHCLGDSVVMTNTTPPLAGYTYQWNINGTPFGNGYNAGVVVTTEGTNTIQLIVSNSFGSDTTTTTINVIGHTVNPFTITANQDSVCAGTMVGFSINNTVSGITYQLRKGFQNIGAAQSGNGGTLNFSYSTAISTATTFNFKAVKTTVCFTDSLIQNKTITIVSNPISLPVSCIPPTSYCGTMGITNVTFGQINNTTSALVTNYFDYSCYQHTDMVFGISYPISVTVTNNGEQNVAVWVDFNHDGTFSLPEMVLNGVTSNFVFTGNITIPAGQLVFNQNVRMRVMSDQSGLGSSDVCGAFGPCGQVEDYAVRILNAPSPPTPTFSTNLTYSCATNVAFTNTTTNATSYSWNFGDGSATSNLFIPTHSYSVAGTYTISLSACNQYGCNTVTHTVTATIPQTPVPSLCNPSSLTTCYGSTRPFIDYLQFGSQFFTSLSGSVHDITCTGQFHLVEDSIYTFAVNCNNNSSGDYFVVYLDLNNDGILGYPSESLMGGSAQNVVISNTGTSIVTIILPNYGVDSVPLRMRMAISDNFINSECSILCGDYKDFTVFLSPHPLTSLFVSNNQSICMSPDSAVVHFTDNSHGATSWLWNFGDGSTSTLQDPGSHTYTTAGIYTVKLYTSNGVTTDSCVRVNYINVKAALAVPPITLNTNILSTITIATHYQWYRNNSTVGMTMDTLAGFTMTLPGTYKVIVTNSNGCTTTSGNFYNAPPVVSFNCSPTTLCGSTATILNNVSTNSNTFTIYWGDTTQTTYNGTGTPTHTYTYPGIYTVKMVGCNTIYCDSMTYTNYITVNAAPVIPVVTNVGNVLSTTAIGTAYQWYKNNVLIAGATATSYTATIDALYKVKVTTAGCNATSLNYGYYPPHISFTADTLSFCNSSATTTFTSTSTNVTTYLWDFGDGNTSISANPSHTYNGYGTYTVKLVGCDSIGCDSLTHTNYVTLNAVSNTVTSISPIGTTNVCNLDTVHLIGNYTAGNTYQWRRNNILINGAVDTAYNTTLSGAYTLITTNGVGCVAVSNIATVFADTSCVWPGDVNGDHNVTNTDMLPIGVYYSHTGTPRSIVSNAWQSYPATDWGVIENPNHIDLKHADCNGDGVIDNNDMVAINQNFNLTHAITAYYNEEKTNAPDIYFVTGSSTYNAGDVVDVDVWVGSSALPASNLYGVTFDMSYTGALVQPGTASLIYTPCWFDTPGVDALTIGQIDTVAHVAYGGITRINHIGMSGFGKVATFQFTANYNISSGTFMYFNFTNYTADDTAGNLISLNPLNSFVFLNPFATSVTETNTIQGVSIYPNPFTDETTISFKEEQKHTIIRITDVLGKEIKTVILSAARNLIIEKGDMERGVYFMEITDENKNTVNRKVVVH